jgi:FkbH-like protein
MGDMETDRAGGTPPETLAGLARSGDLARRYPEVRGLLAGLSDAPDADAVRAGRLLARITADDVRAAHPDVPAVTVAVTGSGVLNGLAAGITGQAARHGIVADVPEPEFDAWVRDLAEPDRPFGAAQLALVVLDAAVATGAVPGPWTADELADALDEKVGLLASLAERFTARSTATLVVTTVPLPRPVLTQLVDHRSRARLSARWRAANQRLLELPGVVAIDLDTLVAEGIAVTDHRLSVYARAHLSPDLLARLAREIGHLARAATGRTKKVLALDLDGTVWGGVLGDDGIEGIEVADSYRGEAFASFQRAVRQLGAQGVLVAAVSKNDLEPVRRVLREHPRTTLREDDFVRVLANWRPKPDNLRQLAADLNLGLDSVVFVDDNPYEVGLVRKELPEVAVVGVDDEPALHVARLLRDGWFDTTEVTADDRARPARYQQEAVRKDFLDSFDSIQDYLAELGVRVRVARANAWELPRIAQLTQRTNQFNLTTVRLAPADVQRLAADPDGYVLGVHAADRFGDNGLVGAVLARRDGDVLRVDNALLSCRVFARGIEQAVLRALLAHARERGLTAVEGRYRRSPKNGTVHDLYPRAGFATVRDDGTDAVFRHDLGRIDPPPGHVHLVTDWERPAAPERTDP